MTKNKLAIFLFIIISFSFCAYSQQSQKNVILLQGKIVDIQSGEGIGTGIQFVDKNGKKIQLRSLGGSGNFQQVLNPNETYTVMFKDYLWAESIKSYTTPNVNEYLEVAKEFKVKKIYTGMELSRFNAFSSNESKLHTGNLSYMYELRDFLSYNPKVNVVITISTSDSYFKSYKKNVPIEGSSKKKKTKSVTVTAEEQLKELANTRIIAFKEFMRTNNIPERLASFETVIKAGSPAQTKTKDSSKKDKKSKQSASVTKDSSAPNVVITVGKILNL